MHQLGAESEEKLREKIKNILSARRKLYSDLEKNQNNLSLTRADIITDRLILRPSDDARDLAEYLSHLEAADEYFIQYGEERSTALVKAVDFHSAPVCYYTVFRKDTGAMVGYVGITPLQRQEAGSLEFYVFR